MIAPIEKHHVFHGDSKTKNRSRFLDCGLSAPQVLPFRELEAATGAFATVFLALFHARITRQSADFAQIGAQFFVEQNQSFGNAVLDRARLTGNAAAGTKRFDVELLFARHAQHAFDKLLRRDARKTFDERFAVDCDVARTGRNPHTRNRVFAFAGAVKSICHDVLSLKGFVDEAA